MCSFMEQTNAQSQLYILHEGITSYIVVILLLREMSEKSGRLLIKRLHDREQHLQKVSKKCISPLLVALIYMRMFHFPALYHWDLITWSD